MFIPRMSRALLVCLLGLSGTTPARAALTSKTLSNPYCYQPDPAVDECVINIRYVQASDNGTSAPYMLYVQIAIDGKVRLRQNLFFENTVTFTYDQVPGGLKVPCGAPNEGGGGAQFGKQYLVRVDPMDVSDTSMGYDQASLYCPAFQP